jgi:hypothetical protein
MRKILFLFIVFPVILLSQQNKTGDIWKPFWYFLGKWEGVGNGSTGSAGSISEWKLIFNEKYLQVTGKAAFDSPDKNPPKDLHEDMGIISHDKIRNKYVFRQFNIEGFVSKYTIDSISADGKYFILNSESIENISSEFKARIIWQILGENEYSWKFYLAQPGKEFICYSDNILKRQITE